MKTRNTIVKFRAGYVQQDDSVIMVDGKTGEKQTYKNKAVIGLLTDVELVRMEAKKKD